MRYYEKTRHQSLYYITSISNAPSIARNGILSHDLADRVPHRDISMQEVQHRRDQVEVVKGVTRLHQYANLYFDARNPMMYARRSEREDLCVLCVSYDVLELGGTVVSDRNASSSYVRFYSPDDAVDHLDFAKVFARDWNANDAISYYDGKSKKCAEVLVWERVPPSCIVGALVCSRDAAAKLSALLREGEADLPVEVYPDVFFA